MADNVFDKICLGTAQFGMNYGIANRTGQVSRDEAARILAYASGQGVGMLDTAYAYGGSESCLGRCLQEGSLTFQLVSKFPGRATCAGSSPEEIFEETLRRLGVERLYGYLAHRSSDVLDDSGLWSFFQELKSSGRVEKIGVSVYSPAELTELEGRGYGMDLVQLPFSLFDRRFSVSFDSLRRRGTEIHARSVFLQGLAFLPERDIPPPLLDAGPVLARLRSLAERAGLSVASLCLNYVLLQDEVDKAVFGVDGCEQLENNLAAVSDLPKVSEIMDQLETIYLDDERLLLPSNWRPG